MKETEYLNLIKDLNETISRNKFFEDLGMYFSYSTTGYSDVIQFGDFIIYCSENDSLSKYDYMVDNYVDISLEDFVIKKLTKLSEELFNISKELKTITI